MIILQNLVIIKTHYLFMLLASGDIRHNGQFLLPLITRKMLGNVHQKTNEVIKCIEEVNESIRSGEVRQRDGRRNCVQ